jgi:hypothetical protein
MIDKMIAQLEAERTIKTVTYFESPTHTEKVTRQFKLFKNDRSATYIVTIGKPNYAEREFVKKCKQSGEPFPVKRLQLKFYPVKK